MTEQTPTNPAQPTPTESTQQTVDKLIAERQKLKAENDAFESELMRGERLRAERIRAGDNFVTQPAVVDPVKEAKERAKAFWKGSQIEKIIDRNS